MTYQSHNLDRHHNTYTNLVELPYHVQFFIFKIKQLKIGLFNLTFFLRIIPLCVGGFSMTNSIQTFDHDPHMIISSKETFLPDFLVIMKHLFQNYKKIMYSDVISMFKYLCYQPRRVKSLYFMSYVFLHYFNISF